MTTLSAGVQSPLRAQALSVSSSLLRVSIPHTVSQARPGQPQPARCVRVIDIGLAVRKEASIVREVVGGFRRIFV